MLRALRVASPPPCGGDTDGPASRFLGVRWKAMQGAVSVSLIDWIDGSMFDWMVWTTPVAVFFSCIALMLAA